MTRGRYIARVSAATGLSNAAGHEELTFMQEWLNQAVRDILQKTHARVELGDLTLSIGVTDYRIDQSVLAMDDRTISGANYDFKIVTLDDIYDLRRSNVSGAGTSISAIAIEGDLALVYPSPTSAQVIRYVYVAEPSPMTADANDPFTAPYGSLPHDTDVELAIEYFMLWRASEYNEEKAPMPPQEYRKAYEGLLVNIRKNKRHRARRGLAPARIGYPDRPFVGRRNDTYPGGR